MTSQNDNNNFIKQVSDAIIYLKSKGNQVQEKNELLSNNKKELENRLHEIRVSLEKEANSKADLFSPSLRSSSDNRCYFLKSEEKEIEKSLYHVESELEELLKEYDSLNNSIKCLQTSKINNKIHTMPSMKVSNSEKTDDNEKMLGISILETQDNERKRIARDLHDSTVQNLTNIMHKTELCTRLIDMDSVRAKLELQTMIQTIKTTIDEMRHIIYDLRPMSIDDLGLVATVEKYINEISRIHELDISFIHVKEDNEILPVINLSLFRIIQEATNNSIKHGKAKKIIIELTYEEESILLSIKDNGIGFDVEESDSMECKIFTKYGLSMMKERVLLLSGNIEIKSNNKSGTQVLVKVPKKGY